ncbi:MAG: cadherin-like domain-containing protein [Planctomycetes bacterium]|nr:cadherin-like domain-containing protein [Planctomycetota bacterium]
MTANPGATVANTAPTFSISNQENLRGDVVALQVNASDADGDTLSYSAMGLPTGLSINSSTGLISGTVSSSAVTNQAYLASVTVNDSGGNVNQNFNWTIVNHAPTLTGHTFYVEKNQPLGNINFLDYASDQDSNDTLTFTPGTGPWQGQLTYNNGIWTYTPASNWTGTDTINGTVSDGAANSTAAYFPFYVVLQTPDQLYATYLAAVATADADYLDAVAARDADIASARADAQSDADDAYADYEDAVAVALADYDDAIADADSDFQNALVDANAAWEAASAAYRASYLTALDEAKDIYDAAVVTLFDDYEAAIGDADAVYDDAIAPFVSARDDAYDAWQLDPDDEELEETYNTAQVALNAAIAGAESQREGDYGNALAAWDASGADAETDLVTAQESALDDFSTAVEPAKEDWEEAESAAWATVATAKDDADADFTNAEATAWSAYLSGIGTIEADLATTETTIEEQYALAVMAAGSTWETAESNAWDDYETAMASMPGSPELAARIDSAPSQAPFAGLAQGSKIEPSLVPGQPHNELFFVVSQPALGDALSRRRFYDTRTSGTVTQNLAGGGSITVAFDYFNANERNTVFARLTSLRQALNTILADIGNTTPFGSTLTFTVWNRLTEQTQTRLGRWFGNGNRLSDYQMHIVRMGFQRVRNAFNGTLPFENDFEGDAYAWTFVGCNIHLQPAFWAQATSVKLQIGTILHEMTHKYHWTGDRGYFYETSLDAGPPGGPRPLPTYWKGDDDVNLSVSQLIGNADTYAGFLMDFYLAGV